MSKKEEKLNQEEISLDNQELNEKEIKELVKEAITEGSPEVKFVLKLTTWNRPGPSFEDYGRMKLLFGEIEKILVDEVYDYPTTNESTYLVIPKTRTVVILFQQGNDYQGEMESHAELYAFTYKKGWFRVKLY